MAKRNFQLGKRRVELRNHELFVGGLPAYGTDLPSDEDLAKRDKQRALFMTELTRFQVWVDGREIHVPRKFWSTCFDPHLKPNEYAFAWLSPDGRRLVVKILGSDGAGSYAAIWTIWRDGRITRTVENLC